MQVHFQRFQRQTYSKRHPMEGSLDASCLLHSKTSKSFVLNLNSNHDEYSFWFDVGKTEHIAEIKRYTCDCSFHIANCRSRIGQLNQSLGNKKYLRVLEEEISKNSVVLSLSDGSLLDPLRSKHVICLEAHRFSRDRKCDSCEELRCN